MKKDLSKFEQDDPLYKILNDDRFSEKEKRRIIQSGAGLRLLQEYAGLSKKDELEKKRNKPEIIEVDYEEIDTTIASGEADSEKDQTYEDYKNVINWAELSRYLTGSRQCIRSNYAAKKYQERINLILNAVEIILTSEQLDAVEICTKLLMCKKKHF